MKTAQRAKTGFTLIELLIVIALLGALAVGLLATIDPFEQIKKGRDTATRNTVTEFYNANLRYYSTKGYFPWGASGLSGTKTADTLVDAITELQNAGELKARFLELAGATRLNKIYVTSSTPDAITVCFKPESKSFQLDVTANYSQDGSPSSVTCKSQQTTGADCYYCIQ